MKNELVTWDNYEEYLLMEVDGELNNAGRQALQAFIAANPEVKEELSMYEDTKLVPDAALTFANKEVLLKHEPKVIAIGGRRWLYAAAAVVAGIAIMWPMFKTAENKTGSLALVIQQQMKAPTPVTPTVKQAPSIAWPTVLEDPNEGIATIHKSSDHHEVKTTTPHPQEAAIAQLNATTPTSITTSRAPIQPLLAANSIEQIQATTMAAKPDESKEEKRGAIHFAPENAAALQNLKSLVASNIEKVQHARNRLRETAVNLRMGNKNLTINF